MRLLFIISFFCISFALFAQEIEYIHYCSNENGNFQIFEKNLTENKTTQITFDNQFNYWWVNTIHSMNKLLIMRSPIINGVKDQFDYENSQMLTMNLDGSNEKIIFNIGANNWTAFGNPHWNEKNQKILFIAQPNNEFYLYTMDYDGNNINQLTDDFSVDANWSKDGSKIVYIGINSNPTPIPSFDDFEVFIAEYNLESDALMNSIQLTDDTKRDHDPCFSPDGSQIAFSSGNIFLTDADIETINVDGTNRTTVVNDAATNGGPLNWGDNNIIYYHRVKLFVTPFQGMSYNFASGDNIELFPSTNAGVISPYYSSKTIQNTDNYFESTVKITPNPMRTDFFLETPDDFVISQMRLYNLLGELVYEFIPNESNFYLVPEKLDGTYFLRFNDAQTIKIQVKN